MINTIYAVGKRIDFVVFGSFIARNIDGVFTNDYTLKTKLTIDEVKEAFKELTYFLREEDANSFALSDTMSAFDENDVLFSRLVFKVKITRIDKNKFKVIKLEAVKSPALPSLQLPTSEELEKIELFIPRHWLFSLYSPQDDIVVTAKNFKNDFSKLQLNCETVTFILCYKFGILNDKGISQKTTLKNLPKDVIKEICSYTK